MTTLVDTNALLRLFQVDHPQFPVAQHVFEKFRKQGVDACISPQNLIEFWAVASRPIANNGLGMSLSRIAAEAKTLHELFRLLEGKSGVVAAWESLVRKHSVSGKQAHDAHLVAVMQVFGVPGILTFNTVDFSRVPEITVLDPLHV